MSDEQFGDGMFLIPEANFKKFEEQLKKLSRKSVKLTGEEITPIVFGYEMIEVGKGKLIKAFNVLLGGAAPKLNGWEFLGRIDHANEAGNIIRALPGKQVPEKYRDTGCICEHCNVKRYRRDTFVVRNEVTGETKQIGSTCLKDFTGHDSPEKIAKLAELLSYAAEVARGYRNSVGDDHRYYQLDEFLANVAAVTEKYGYVSRKNASEREVESTASAAMSNMFKWADEGRYVVEVTAAHRDQAAQATEWAQNLGEDGAELNDYQHNIKVIAASGVIEWRSVGYAASILGSYMRELQQFNVRKPKQESMHVGKVGEKIVNQKLTVTFYRAYVRDDDTVSHQYMFKDDRDNVFVWWASRGQDIDKGDEVTLNVGTVKQHTEYKGTKQTVLTRCKLEKN